MALSLTGLSSGIDTDAVVEQLMTVERKGRSRLTLADFRASSRQTGLRELATKLTAVRDAAVALRSAGTWAPTQTTTSSDAARVAVRREAGAAPGEHVVEVQSLAVSAQRAFDYTASASTQTVKIGAFSLDIAADTTIDDAATAINDRDDSPVSAVVAGGKLVLTAKATGAASAFTVDATPLLAHDPAYARAGADAAYTLDGTPKTSATNVISTAILGVEVTLKGKTTGPVTVTVGAPGPDADAIQAKVKAFVDAYNAAADTIRSKLAEKKVAAPTTNAEASKGLFFGDTMLTGVLSGMRTQIADLADLGISTGATTGSGTFSADAVAGRLQLDATKLAAALKDDPAALRARLGGPDGLADRLDTIITPVAGERIDERLTAADDERKRLAGALTATDSRLALREKRLRAQFAAMEAAMAVSQSALAQLQSRLGTA